MNDLTRQKLTLTDIMKHYTGLNKVQSVLVIIFQIVCLSIKLIS